MALQTPSSPSPWTFPRVIGATLILVFIALGFWLLYRFGQVVFIFFIAVVIGTVIRPVVAWLYSRGVPRIAGVSLIYFVLLALIITFVVLLFPMIVEQGRTISAAMPGYYQSLREWMAHNPNQLVVHFGDLLPATLPYLGPIQPTGQPNLVSAEQALGYAVSAANVLFSAAAFLLLSIHWTLDGPRIIRSFLLIIPKGQRENISELVSAIETKVGSYIAAQGLLCLVIGILSLIAYLLIGLPNALVLAIVAGLLEAVPMVGPVLGSIPAAVIAFSISPSKLIWVIVATTVIQQAENNLLVPRVMHKTVGVNPFVSMLAIFAFGSLFGIAGALMAIPIAAILQLLLDRFVFNAGTMESEVSTGRDYVSRLRYEVQDLAHGLRKQGQIQKGGSDLMLKQTDQVLDEIETIAADLDSLLSQVNQTSAP
jgi:predicted PurR-regulated permease PerM